jgi:hypothetical protein
MQTITFAAIKVLNMKKILLIAFVALLSLSAAAQNKVTGKDSTTFKGYLYNEKYNVYLVIDFYHNNVIVPNQEIYGEMAGYFGDRQDGRKWLFTDAKIVSKDKAEIQITNDYGSEDLTASLTAIDDKNFKFRQEDGSTLKIARNRKWLKMPKELDFVKR